jgi:FkbM family methyltransferase
VFGISASALVDSLRKKGPFIAQELKDAWNKRQCTTQPAYIHSLVLKPAVEADAKGVRPRAFCLELMSGTTKALTQTRSMLPTSDQDTIVIHQRAVGTGYPPTLEVAQVKPGRENAGVGVINKGQNDTVLHVTLDTYMRRRPQPIDFLLIDTEGNDAFVLWGGAVTLARTRFVTFENHQRGAWQTVSLRSVIDYLDVQGFDCFWMANSGALWQITGGCYPMMELKRWSNIGCAKRGDLFLTIFRELARQNEGIVV